MTTDELLDAIGIIDDEAIRDAKEYQRPTSHRIVKWSVIAACLALCVALFGVAYSQGLITLDWIEKLFGVSEQVELLEGQVISIDESAVSNGINLTLNSIVTDGSIIYADFNISQLEGEILEKDFNFHVGLPTFKGYGGSGSLTPIANSESNSDNDNQEFVLRYTVSGMNLNLLGKTITLIVNYHDGGSGEFTSKWIFEVKLNNVMESVSYTMQDGTGVIVTPISIALEQWSFFGKSADNYKVEMADGSLINLTGSSSYEEGHIDENGNKIPRYKVNNIMFVEVIDPHEIVAIWAMGTRYELVPDQ